MDIKPKIPTGVKNLGAILMGGTPTLYAEDSSFQELLQKLSDTAQKKQQGGKGSWKLSKSRGIKTRL